MTRWIRRGSDAASFDHLVGAGEQDQDTRARRARASCATRKRPGADSGRYSVEHTGATMAVAILKELVGGARHRHLVIEPKLRGRPKTRQIVHRRAKDAHVGRMRLRPAFECSETFPPAHAVGFFR